MLKATLSAAKKESTAKLCEIWLGIWNILFNFMRIIAVSDRSGTVLPCPSKIQQFGSNINRGFVYLNRTEFNWYRKVDRGLTKAPSICRHLEFTIYLALRTLKCKLNWRPNWRSIVLILFDRCYVLTEKKNRQIATDFNQKTISH